MAVDHDFNDVSTKGPFQIIDVTEAAWVTVALPEDDITIKHRGFQPGGRVVSTADEVLYVQQAEDADGVPDATAGRKAILEPGEALMILGAKARPLVAEGQQRCIKLRAHAASNPISVQILSGELSQRQ